MTWYCACHAIPSLSDVISHPYSSHSSLSVSLANRIRRVVAGFSVTVSIFSSILAPASCAASLKASLSVMPSMLMVASGAIFLVALEVSLVEAKLWAGAPGPREVVGSLLAIRTIPMS